MTTIQPAQALAAYAEAKNRQDVEGALALCAPQCTYECPGLQLRIEGKARLRGFYLNLFESLPDYYGRLDEAAIAGEVAMMTGAWGGTTTSRFMGVAVEPGRRIEVPVCFVCTFQGGLLVRDVGHFDSATLAEQLAVDLTLLRGRSHDTAPLRSAGATGA